jgi:beta-1,4-mannosyl-glycoprotein beta-1,4-N-acetylglucosaminyltransferase
MKRKIYDCFAFFNEMDLLELRLRDLWDVVDHFVIVEATRTFQKKEKPLYFAQNRERYKEFESKIIHVVVDKYPTFWTKFRPVTTWHYDNHQKEGILQGLKNAGPEDLVIVSDLDELPLPEKILEFRDKKGIRVFEQYQSYYFLNYVCTRIHDYGGKAVAQRNRDGYGRWRGSVMLEKKLIKTIKDTRNFRDEEGPHIEVIRDGGWHFSYMGGIEKILYKIDSWAHVEYKKYGSRENVIESILQGRDLFEEGSRYELKDIRTSGLPFPKEIVEHPARWAAMIRTPEQLREELALVKNPEPFAGH